MLIYDDIFKWDGWGRALRLASGQCHLKVYDLQKDHSKDHSKDLIHLKPIIVLVTDISRPPNTKDVTIRSCAGHIATSVVGKLKINPSRMFYAEYYRKTTYGKKKEFTIRERFDAVDFIWKEGRALKPKWRAITSPLLDQLIELITS